MIKVLVVCKNIENSKKIINNIICKISDLQITGIANSFEEAKELLMNNESDIIITTNQKIIEYLKVEFITYKPGIIIIDSIVRLENYYQKALLLDNKYDFETMKDKIVFFIKHYVESSQKEKIFNLLTKLGFEYNWSGTVYIQDAILYAHSYKGSYSFEHLKRDVYSEVALKNNTTISKVKWSIERALLYLYNKNLEETYSLSEELFKIKYPRRMTSKQIISIIANLLDDL